MILLLSIASAFAGELVIPTPDAMSLDGGSMTVAAAVAGAVWHLGRKLGEAVDEIKKLAHEMREGDPIAVELSGKVEVEGKSEPSP